MKLIELCEGYWKNIDIQNREKSEIPQEKFNIMVNGHLWKKDGIPVELSKEAALKSANTISSRYNKITQIVPYKK